MNFELVLMKQREQLIRTWHSLHTRTQTEVDVAVDVTPTNSTLTLKGRGSFHQDSMKTQTTTTCIKE